MKKRICSSVVAGSLICSVFGSVSVNANTLDKQLSKVSSDGMLNVSGSLDLKENNIPINLVIREKDTMKVLAIKQAVTDEEGKYTFSVNLEDVISKGGNFSYRTIGQVENEEDDEFKYYTKKELENVVNQINDEKNKVSSGENTYDTALSKIETVLKNNKDLLSFSKSEMAQLIESNSARVAKMLYDETITNEDVIKYLTESDIIINIEKSSSADEIATFMAQPELRLDGVSEYKSLKEPEKGQLNQRFAKSKSTYARFSDFYAAVRENIIILNLYNNRGTASIEKMLTNYTDLFNLDTYNKTSSDKTAVLKKIDKAIESNQIDSIADVQKILDVYVAKKTTSSSSGGSGGGSGSGSGSVSMVIGTGKTEYNPSDVVETKKTEYSDLENYEWAKEHIEKLSKLKVLSGYDDGTYRPQNEVTRAEAAKMIYLAFGIELNGINKFNDVDGDAWYAKHVSALSTAEIINGIDGVTFNPNGKVTRQDLCTILFRALRYKGFMVNNSEYVAKFTDGEEISDYAVEAVNRLAEAEIISGFEDGSFKPSAVCSRAETAKLISMIYDYMN